MAASVVKIPPVGRINSNNDAELEKQIRAQLAGKGNAPVGLDAEKNWNNIPVPDCAYCCGLKISCYFRYWRQFQCL